MKTYKINTHNKEVIVFFNPLGTDSNFWKNIIPQELINSYDILLIDYPGYNSEFTQHASMQKLADEIHQTFILKITKPMHFFGYSYGGMVVQLLMNNQYENLRSVVLIASSNSPTHRDLEIVSVLKGILQHDMYLFCRALNIFSQSPESINENQLMPLQMFSNLKVTTSGIDPVLQQINHILKIKKIEIRKQATPVLIIFGENDRLLEASAIKDFSLFFDNLKILKLSNAYHIINLESVADKVTDFLKSNSYE
jgi:pimeloyl-ACP methyl ester carboxylesterase